MDLTELSEAKISHSKVGAAMTSVISYLERALGAKFRKLGTEHFHNSAEQGFGVRYLEDGTLNCLRFNWEGASSKEIVSVDMWNGTSRNPQFNIAFKGISLAKALPDLVRLLKKPKVGHHPVTGDVVLAEAKGSTTLVKKGHELYDCLMKHAAKEVKKLLDEPNTKQLYAGRYSAKPGAIDAREVAAVKMANGSIAFRIDGTLDEAKKNVHPKFPDAEYDPEISDKNVAGFTDSDGEQRYVRRKDLPDGHPAKNAELNEAKKGEFSGAGAIKDMIAKLEAGRSFNRSEFIMAYHPENAHAYDEWVENNQDQLVISGKRISLPKGTKFGDAKGSHVGAHGELIVTKGGSGEQYEVDVPAPDRISFADSLEHLEGLATVLIKGSTNALFVAGRGGTGKTQTIEDVLSSHGLTDGDGYFKITGSASPIGIYTMLYKYRTGIVMFDDCDGALESQDGRNIIKAATDTKKIRKVAWGKKNAGMFDPDDEPEKDEPAEAEDDDDQINDLRIPRHFNFTGRVIFISNMPLNKLDPDGALRTRAFVINIDPTPEEMFDRMGQILHHVKLEQGSLSKEEREEVMKVVRTSRRAKDASLRTLVRGLNLAASGAPNWKRLVELYA